MSARLAASVVLSIMMIRKGTRALYYHSSSPALASLGSKEKEKIILVPWVFGGKGGLWMRDGSTSTGTHGIVSIRSSGPEHAQRGARMARSPKGRSARKQFSLVGFRSERERELRVWRCSQAGIKRRLSSPNHSYSRALTLSQTISARKKTASRKAPSRYVLFGVRVSRASEFWWIPPIGPDPVQAPAVRV